MAQAPSRCLNHPERTAVARCKQCHKPLCQHCALKKPGGSFCSEECFGKMGSFQERVEVLDSQKKAGLNLGKLVKWVVIVAVGGGILYYVFVAEGVRGVGDLVDMIKGFLP